MLLGGAALTRTYVERDLREVYEGRLFYGKDAFEGLHTMDRLMDDEARRRWTTPTSAACPTVATCPAALRARRSPDRRAARPLARRGHRQPGVRRRRSSARGSSRASSLDDIAAYVNETALFRNQWQFRPEKRRRHGETDDEFKARIRPQLRAQLAAAKAAGVLVPQVVYGYFAGQRRRRRPVVWTDESPHRRAGPLPLPPPDRSTRSCASPTSSARSTSRRGRLRRLPHRHDGRRRSARPTAELFADNQYQEYLLLHGLGVEMAEALAE